MHEVLDGVLRAIDNKNHEWSSGWKAIWSLFKMKNFMKPCIGFFKKPCMYILYGDEMYLSIITMN